MNLFLEKLYYQNSLKSWGISLLIILLSFLGGRALFWFFKKFVRKIISKSKLRIDDILIQSAETPLVAFIVNYGIYFGVSRLKLPTRLDHFVHNFFIGIATMCVTWFCVRFIKNIFDVYLSPMVKKTENQLDDQLLPVLKKGSIIIIWILGGVVALNNAGLDVGALVAGMGIGGLALAMAAKDTLSNFFGGITIFTDRTFKLGDRVKLNGFEGIVEEIGLRSTRLRTLEGRIVTIPNAKFTESIIENVTLEPSRKIIQKLGLTYSTDVKQLKMAQEILKKLADDDFRTENKSIISFSEFADSSLVLTFIYYIKRGEDIFQVMNDINFAILENFNQSGLDFAFPSQSIYLEKN